MEKVLIQKAMDRGLPGINQVILIGNIGKDPTLFDTQGGGKVLRFSMATNEIITENKTEFRLTEWHDIWCSGYLAARVSPELKKGSRVQVVGRLFKSKFKGTDGRDIERTEVQAEFIARLEEGKYMAQEAPDVAAARRKVEEINAILASTKPAEETPKEMEWVGGEEDLVDLTQDEMDAMMAQNSMELVDDYQEPQEAEAPGNPFLS